MVEVAGDLGRWIYKSPEAGMEQQSALREYYVDELRAICNCHAGNDLIPDLPKTSQAHKTDCQFHRAEQQQLRTPHRKAKSARS